MAVLAILSADFISRSNYSGPHRSCGSLRNSLQLEGCFALGRKPLVHLLDRLLNVDGVQMAVQLRLDASWMYRRGAYAITSMTPVESNGEEDIRSLGPAVSNGTCNESTRYDFSFPSLHDDCQLLISKFESDV